MTTESDIAELTRRVVQFANDRDWSQFHDPKNLVMALSSEVGELSGLLRWIPNEAADLAARDETMARQIADEIGDVGILLLLLCARLDLPLGRLVTAKLEKNAEKYPVEVSKGKSERPNTG